MRRLGLVPLLASCGRIAFDAHPGAPPDAPFDVASCPPSIGTGMVGHWAFDDGSGLTAADSAAGNAGTLINGPVWTTGRLGGALAFDGVDDHVDIAGGVVYATSTQPFSFAAWFNLTDYSTTTPDIMQIHSDTPSPFHVLMSSMPQYLGISLGSGDGQWIPIKTQSQPSTGVWHHIVVTYNGQGAGTIASYQILLDGAVQPMVAAAGYGSQAQQSRIGAAEDPRNDWIGRIDDVRIYNRILATDETDALGAGCP
jgi:hypothetical protein